MAKQTLKDTKWVSENVESSLRKDNLSFNHHREVASLPPEKQEAVAEIVGVPQNTISVIVDNIRKRQLSIFDKDFKPFIYNIKKPPVVVALFLRSCNNRKQE